MTKTAAKKSILVLSHSPYVGGAELALKSLIESTKGQYNWTVIVPGTITPDAAITPDSVEYITLPGLPWWCYEQHDKPPLINKRLLEKSLTMLRRLAQKADILLTNSMVIPWLGFIAHETNKPHIWYIHEYGDIDHNLNFIAGYSETLRMITACSSRVLTISNDVKEHIGRIIPKNKIDIIRQSIDLTDLTSIQAVESFDKLSLLCLGAIKPSKGQHVALEAVAQTPNVTLDIIGPAADHQFANDLVERAKELPHVLVQIRRYTPLIELATHNVLLMCSEHEGLGRVTLEALAAGRLVIGYGCRSTKELLADNRGLLYSPNTPESLRRAIQTASNKLRQTPVDFEQNRAYVSQEFSQDAQAADFYRCASKAGPLPTTAKPSILAYAKIIDANNLWEKPAHQVLTRARHITPAPLKQLVKRLIRRT